MEIQLSEDQNTAIVDGVKYEAVPLADHEDVKGACNRCDLFDLNSEMKCVKCTDWERLDGLEVIWKRKEEK